MAATLLVGLLAGCPTVDAPCSAESCARGCCDAEGLCRAPSVSTCGVSGSACVACTTSARCMAGACVLPVDAGPRDAGALDAGVSDGGAPDAGPRDAGHCSGLPLGAPPNDPFRRARTLVDQPDDEPNLPSIHVLYVEPGDVTAARALDVEGDLRRSLEAANGWLAARTGGPRFRFDRCEGALDITFVKLPSVATEAMLATGVGDVVTPGPHTIRDRLARAVASQFNAPNKLYLIYWDGLAYAHCGGAAYPPALADHYTAMFRGGLFQATFLTAPAASGATTLTVYSADELGLPAAPFTAAVDAEPVQVTARTATTLTLAQPLTASHGAMAKVAAESTITPCRGNPLSVDGVALGYAEFAAMHELLHPLGIVGAGAADFAAPPIAPGHLGDSNPSGGDDLMYQGAQPWTCDWNAPNPAASRCVLDPTHRNYWQLPMSSTGVDLARSAFLVPSPTDAQLPQHW